MAAQTRLRGPGRQNVKPARWRALTAWLAVLFLSGPVFAQDLRIPMMVNLAPVNDWSVQQPFLDVMKTARPWFGHKRRQWGGMSHEELQASGYLDDHGWPLAIPPGMGSVGTVILTDLPEQAVTLAGQYRLRFEGTGIVEVAGRASNKHYGKGEVWFDFTPGLGPVDIRIQRSAENDPVRAITVVHERHIDAFDAGEQFNPDWLARIDGFSSLRFISWMDTNDSTQSKWADRPEPGDATYALNGVPVEVMLVLAGRLGADPWFTLPHMADDAYIHAFAETVSGGMDPDLKVYAEYSNEVWNWQFGQAKWADEQARARWGRDNAWMQFYGLRAAQAARIWSDVFAGDDRLINVIGVQTGWLGLEQEALLAPLAQAEGFPAPSEAFDAYAVTGYFGYDLGEADNADRLQGWLAESRAADPGRPYDLAVARAAQDVREGSLDDLVTRLWPHHAKVATVHGYELLMYEGGTHITGLWPVVDDETLTSFFTHLNYTPEIAELYEVLFAEWHGVGGRLFGVFNDVSAPSKWGSWGALRHLGDDNPRWDVIQRYRQ